MLMLVWFCWYCVVGWWCSWCCCWLVVLWLWEFCVLWLLSWWSVFIVFFMVGEEMCGWFFLVFWWLEWLWRVFEFDVGWDKKWFFWCCLFLWLGWNRWNLLCVIGVLWVRDCDGWFWWFGNCSFVWNLLIWLVCGWCFEVMLVLGRCLCGVWFLYLCRFEMGFL